MYKNREWRREFVNIGNNNNNDEGGGEAGKKKKTCWVTEKHQRPSDHRQPAINNQPHRRWTECINTEQKEGENNLIS